MGWEGSSGNLSLCLGQQTARFSSQACECHSTPLQRSQLVRLHRLADGLQRARRPGGDEHGVQAQRQPPVLLGRVDQVDLLQPVWGAAGREQVCVYESVGNESTEACVRQAAQAAAAAAATATWRRSAVVQALLRCAILLQRAPGPWKYEARLGSPSRGGHFPAAVSRERSMLVKPGGADVNGGGRPLK